MNSGTMRAAAVDEFGPPQNLRVTSRPAPAARVIGVVGRDPGRAPRECTDVVLAADLDRELPRLTADGLVDVIIDPVGGPQRAAAFGHLAPFGRHIVLGDASGDDRPFSGDQAWPGSRVIAGLSTGGRSPIAAPRPRPC